MAHINKTKRHKLLRHRCSMQLALKEAKLTLKQKLWMTPKRGWNEKASR